MSSGWHDPGKQPGAPGAHLAQVPDPDQVVVHRPERCDGCSGGYRALLIEALHPLAIAAVEQHSHLLDHPWRRLWRTSQYVFDVTFGDRATAQLVGIPADLAPQDVAGLRAFLAEVPLLMTPGAARVRELVLHPPISWMWRPLAGVFRAAVLAVLPKPVRDIYGFSVSEWKRGATRTAVRSLCRAANWLARLPFQEDMFAPVTEPLR